MPLIFEVTALLLSSQIIDTFVVKRLSHKKRLNVDVVMDSDNNILSSLNIDFTTEASSAS